MFDDEVREQIFAKSELQKIDLMTLSLRGREYAR